MYRKFLFLLQISVFALLSTVSYASDFKERTVITNATSQFIEILLEKLETNFAEVGNGSYSFSLKGYKVALFNKGDDIQLFSKFTGRTITLNRVNEWNRTRRFTRAYLDKDGDACIEADLDFEGGVTVEAILRFIVIFAQSVESYAEYLQ